MDAAGDAFTEGLQILSATFDAVPEAFASLMENLVNDYVDALQDLGKSPDEEFLKPIMAKLKALKGE